MSSSDPERLARDMIANGRAAVAGAADGRHRGAPA
jgi:hypothetical protein